MRSPPLPPETPGLQIADENGRVRVYYLVRDDTGQEFEGSTFIIASETDTLATLSLDAEEAAYLSAVTGSNATRPITVQSILVADILPALPLI